MLLTFMDKYILLQKGTEGVIMINKAIDLLASDIRYETSFSVLGILVMPHILLNFKLL